MNSPRCPECDCLLPSEALKDGKCPACSGGTKPTGWFTLIACVVVGLTGGILFGMAKYGLLTGPWVLVPVLILATLAVGRWIELSRRR